MQGDEQVAAGLQAQAPRPPRGRGSAARARPGCRSSCCRRTRQRSSPIPSRAGSPSPPASAGSSSSAMWSVTTRLTSSGIERSKLRSPDSTWATAIPSLAAHSAAASVELTSPGTRTRSGRSLAAPARAAPAPARSAPRGSPSRPRACGRARARRAPRGRSRTSAGRSAGRCGRSPTAVGDPIAQRRDHRRHLDEVRARPDDVDDAHRASTSALRCASRARSRSRSARRPRGS